MGDDVGVGLDLRDGESQSDKQLFDQVPVAGCIDAFAVRDALQHGSSSDASGPAGNPPRPPVCLLYSGPAGRLPPLGQVVLSSLWLQ